MIDILKKRFLENMSRHPDLSWEEAEGRLAGNERALEALGRMEETGGEPDTIGWDGESGKLIFLDCSAETPAGRRSLCYDDEALKKRKKNPPSGSALSMARDMGCSLLTEDLYRRLQETGEFDLKTSSWIAAPEEIRSLGGALFGERRYGRVFTFHNGADSYYSVRGWRGFILV
ncbi:MAG: DUF4256 domain-containing protein [Lachnospiraceae bacterium]|nr:DUF4256 domain-containing protein [Lachnospiraceae bacterium]MBQ4305054.1 DUF4256 domain-containing protein [Lachnospiraceae bacterium]MBQ5359712.1 DUF4256 domain-containing protein [Lachnospiraceae bacterium]